MQQITTDTKPQLTQQLTINTKLIYCVRNTQKQFHIANHN